MQNRVRLLMGASALLYFGPLLSGLTGMGWNAVPVFMALFALWLVVMRPSDWPRDLSRWTGSTVLAALAQLAVNMAIVVALFAVGRGIGGVAGFVPNIPPLVPVALSFLATPLSRLVWDPVQGDAVERFVDDAIAQIENGERRRLAAGPGDGMVDTLLGLPEDADPELTAEALDAALRGREGTMRLSLLEDALDLVEPERLALRKALILWATDPARIEAVGVRGGPMTAFSLAGLRPDLLQLFATRSLELLGRAPGMVVNFPESSDIEMSVDDAQPAPLRDALLRLARQIRALEETGARG